LIFLKRTKRHIPEKNGMSRIGSGTLSEEYSKNDNYDPETLSEEHSFPFFFAAGTSNVNGTKL